MKKVKDILKVIFLLLAILTMLVSLFGRASAENIIISDYSDLVYYFDDSLPFNDYQKTSIASLYQEFPYYLIYKGGSTYNLIYFFNDPLIFLTNFDLGIFYTFSVPNGNGWSNGLLSTNRSDDFKIACLYSFDSSGWHGFRSNLNYYNFYVENVYNISPVDINGFSFQIGRVSNISFNSLYSNVDVFIGNYDFNYIIRSQVKISSNIDSVIVNPDISVYKSLDNNGLPVLNVSWSKTPLPTTGGINYAGYTNVDIKFNIDGNERVVSINSDDYPELFSNYADGKFYIPWSVFQKVALLVTDFDQVNEVSVIQVDVSMKGYPQSASIESAQTYSMNTLVDPALVFKGQDSSIPVFDNDQIVKQPDEDVSINVTEYNDYIQSFNSYRNSDGLWHLVSSYDNDTNSDVLHINAYVDDPNSPDGYVIDHFSLDSSGGSLNDGAYFSDYFYENAYTLDYDMIVFHVFVDRRPAAVDFVPSFNGYIVYYTNRYYLRLLNTQAVNISDLFRVSNNYAYMTYDFLFDRLNNINDNMIAYFVSDSNKQNTAISYLGSINVGLNNLNSNFVNLTASTHNYLDRILSAVNGIDFEGTDLTGVLSKMDSISSSVSSLPNAIRSDLVYLFKPSYDDIDVSFQQYKDSIGILSLPFDTSKMVLETVDQNYNGKLSIDVPGIKFMSYELFGGQHYELDPWQFFDDQELSEGDDPTGLGFVKGLRYFIAFSAILGAVLGTYLHIFRRVES